ncbi:hypothetical protein SAMN04489713_104326 [Actinomadura madurae]|uniref:Uncharacterized protein n=1 Tax=Actinomadura madurae TaxID=1993 RepID=A0A1I5EX89_9ACTN|nr:hypothetical protein [Actinomadura madurae]SFO16067.1 hypothetical protein SAMN04489713_104326 [Actinomadura madurae]
MVKPLPMEVLSSKLLTLDEIGADLAQLTIRVRTSRTGVTHAPRCRQVGKNTAPEEVTTVSELRAGGEFRPCRTCGGAVVEELSAGQTEQLAALIPLLERRLQQVVEEERAKREERDRIRRADLIDKRAGYIVRGWTREIEEERRFAVRYPAEHRAAIVACDDCGAKATVSFDPRSLEVSYVCPSDSEHGFVHLRNGGRRLAAWVHRGGKELVALGLVAPVLAGADDAWVLTYATRADDYRTTVSAMEDFDRAYPPRLRLAPDIRCGECGDPLSSWPGIPGSEPRIEAAYSCDNRHEDGKYRHHEKSLVDERIDSILHRRLREHPPWATAKELEFDQGAVAAYADDLARKMAIFDACVGAAKSVDELVKTRSQLAEGLDLVSRIRDQGCLAIADLTRYAAGYAAYTPRWTFSELARALLTKRIDVTEQSVTVFTLFDDGTPLQRLLRSREIKDELAELGERQRELEQELADLDRRL